MRSRALGLVQSPFRYPGGKSRLLPTVRTWLATRGSEHIVEPFAGGASVSLAAVSEGLARDATLSELDEEVAGVWSVMLGERAHELPVWSWRAFARGVSVRRVRVIPLARRGALGR